MIHKLSQREKMIAGLTAVVVLLAGVFFGVYRPLKGMMEDIDDATQTVEEKLIRGKRNMNLSANASASLDQIVGQWGKASSDSVEFSGLTNALETAAKATSVKIINIEPRAVIKDIVARYPVAITINGSSRNIMEFLRLIQSQPLLLDVESMNLERGVDSNGTVNGVLVVERLRIL